jgi:hypothetical protein
MKNKIIRTKNKAIISNDNWKNKISFFLDNT